MKNFTYTCFAFVMLFAELINAQSIQRVRIDFETPLGYTRQLLLGFTTDNVATDGFNYGYDAVNGDNFPDDFSWMIKNQKYIIQGVGAFSPNKQYPVGIFMTNSGRIRASLNSLENFDSPIEVYIYDAYQETYTILNDNIFEKEIKSGNVEDRFYITFVNNNMSRSLTSNQSETFPFIMKYDKNSHELSFKASQYARLLKIEIFNDNGSKLFQINNFNKEEFSARIPHNYTGVALVKVTTQEEEFLKKILLH